MQPVIIEDSISVSANTVVENIIASNASLRGLLQCPFPAQGKLLAVISATGLAIDFSYGGKLVVSNSVPEINTVAEEPNDIINDEFYPAEGDQLVLRVSNTTGGALTLRYRIVLTPLVDESTWSPGMPFDMSPYPDTRVMQRGAVAISNGTVDQQLLDGFTFERLSVPSKLRVLMTASATGMTRQLFIEQDRIAPPSAINLNNRAPQDPFDSTIDEVEVPANALQQLMVTNNSGGSLNVFWKTKNRELVRR